MVSIFSVTLLASGSVGSHFSIVSSSFTFFSSTNCNNRLLRYSNATAPLRKYMSVVAGTPVIDCPNAWFATSWSSFVTFTMTARKCCDFINDWTMFAMSDASFVFGAGSAVAPGVLDGEADVVADFELEHAANDVVATSSAARGTTGGGEAWSRLSGLTQVGRT